MQGFRLYCRFFGYVMHDKVLTLWEYENKYWNPFRGNFEVRGHWKCLGFSNTVSTRTSKLIIFAGRKQLIVSRQMKSHFWLDDRTFPNFSSNESRKELYVACSSTTNSNTSSMHQTSKSISWQTLRVCDSFFRNVGNIENFKVEKRYRPKCTSFEVIFYGYWIPLRLNLIFQRI